MNEKSLWERLKLSTKQIFLILVFMLILEVVNHFSGYALSKMGGIIPREPHRLFAVFTAPFLHFSPNHLLLNSLPFAIFGCLICLQDKRLFIKLTLFSSFFAGLAVWALARGGNSVHAGSSLLIFAYFGFLLASGWYAKNWKSLILAVIVMFFFGGMLMGVLPTKDFVSWESHLFGLIAGVVYAKIIGPQK